MKVLLTCPTYPPFNSGLGNVVQRQALALVEAGCSVVVATGGPGRSRRDDLGSGALVEEFNVSGADCLLQPIKGEPDSYARFLTDSCFDVVVFNAWQTWSTDIGLRRLDQISGRKILYSNCISTNLWIPSQPFRSMVRYLAWRPYWYRVGALMKKLDGLIFVSSNGCDSRFDDLRLAQKLGLPFSVVPNPLSRSATDVMNSSVKRERKQLIAVGSYDWFKGHDFVLRCYAGSNVKNIVKLKIFGQKFSSFTDDLKKLAERLGIKEEFLSFYENTPTDTLLREYSQSYLLLSGSHTECQPLVLVDAMATGTPFVARARGCIPFLGGGVAVNSEAEAIGAINRLFEDQGEWNSLSDAGRAEVDSQHHPAVFSDKFLAAIT